MFTVFEILCLVGIFIGAWKLGKFLEELRDSVVNLNERLTKLEKDAVKITFTPPFSTGDDGHIVHPEVKKKHNPKQFDGVESDKPFIKTRKKRKPKTVEDWEEEIDLGGHE